MEKTKEEYPNAKKKSNFILCGKPLWLLAKVARLDLESHWDAWTKEDGEHPKSQRGC